MNSHLLYFSHMFTNREVAMLGIVTITLLAFSSAALAQAPALHKMGKL